MSNKLSFLIYMAYLTKWMPLLNNKIKIKKCRSFLKYLNYNNTIVVACGCDNRLCLQFYICYKDGEPIPEYRPYLEYIGFDGFKYKDCP